MPCIPSARDITSLYPEGTATIVTIAMNHGRKFKYSYPIEPSAIGEKPSWQNERLALWGVAHRRAQTKKLKKANNVAY